MTQDPQDPQDPQDSQDSEPPDERQHEPQDERDVRTQLATLVDDHRMHELMAPVVYQRAREFLAARSEETHAAPGYWVFHAGPGGVPMGFVASGPRQYAVLGRHHCADIRADETMSGISLRQALLRVRQEAGRLVLHVLDLHSTHGLRLLDGTPVGALEIRGPVALTVAGHLLVCVPEHLHEPLPESLPAPELLRLRDALPGPPPRVSEGGRLPVAAGDVREQSTDRPGTYVRARGASTLLSAIPLQPLDRDARSQLEVNVDRAHERDATLLRVTLAQRALGVLALSKSVLETGVLVGRYERCWNQAGAGVSLPNEVSRVHALLLREGPELLHFDLASSNGTERNGHAVRCAALTPGDVLGLSDQLEFRVL